MKFIIFSVVFLVSCAQPKNFFNQSGDISNRTYTQQELNNLYPPLISCKTLVGNCPDCYHVDRTEADRLAELAIRGNEYKMEKCL